MALCEEKYLMKCKVVRSIAVAVNLIVCVSIDQELHSSKFLLISQVKVG